MKAVFIAEDENEAKRLAKANDMAFFISELVLNGWRRFKHTDYDYLKSWDVISELLDEYGINVDDLNQ